MALDVNGYNADFSAFVKFAEQHFASNRKAVARFGEGPARTIVASDPHLDSVGKFRDQDQCDLNNAIRSCFKAAICDMFGGEANIPARVKKEMLLVDYNKGKPLTARRIMFIKNAIDLDGSAKVRAAELAAKEAARREREAVDAQYGSFESEETKNAALADGFTRGELKEVAKAVNFLRAANPGMTEAAAYEQVSTPFSKANRLLQYGGNFMKNAANFARGLQLLDDFKAWHDDLRAFYKDHTNGLTTDFTAADTPTKLNIAGKLVASEKKLLGLESLVFHDLAGDPNADLSKTGEDLFGVENNGMMRLCVNEHDSQAAGNLLSFPPKTRRILYAAFDALVGTVKTPEEARRRQDARSRDKQVEENLIFMARVVKYGDALAAKMAKGGLTARDVIKTCFPEMKKPARYNLAALNRFLDMFETIEKTCGEDSYNAVSEIMKMSGCTMKEAIDSYKKSRPLPFLPHLAGYSFDYSEHRDGGVKQLKADLVRGTNYGRLGTDGRPVPGSELLAADEAKYTFKFPGEDRFGIDGQPAVEKVADKVQALCGKGHGIQANVVGYCLTQSANGQLKRALDRYGIFADEHVVLNYELSKSDETGAVTIKYSSPAGLPVKFSWTTTVAVDGSSTSTSMVVVPPAQGQQN